MPRSSCEPCCNPSELARSQPMYRDAHLQILCAMLDALVGGGGVGESVVVTSVTPGVGATNLGKAEDSSHTSGDVGILGLTVRQDVPVKDTSADGDYASSKSNSVGAIYVALVPGVPQTIRANFTAAQTNVSLLGAIAAGTRAVITRCTVAASYANTVAVSVVIGFGSATTPTTTGVVLAHPGIAPGSGMMDGVGSGILGQGNSDEELRITSSVPTTGSIDVTVTYYTEAI